MVDFLETFKKLLSGGSEELGRDDLLRRVADGISRMRTWGAKGSELFPPAVVVKISVADASVSLIKEMVDDPAFDHEVEARLKNTLVRVTGVRMPVRRYEVREASENRIQVKEDSESAVTRLTIEGGDLDGQTLDMPTRQRVFRMGRGEWHGSDRVVPNDLVITNSDAFVSRAAAIIRRVGAFLELETRDQGEFLLLHRGDGARVRPAMTAKGRVLVRPGDSIAFTDGASKRITIKVVED